ncbi:hypothetical protein Hamer_G013312 [Homarus americanus]|uniref:Uncharacterized protein n=1 Tax=Homarus americanus TaxID=6706 RepID=A0A8J5MZF4_HOMAM|nr:hypothetical protein Hamer_G013312 [Homarus americanus]
MAKMVVNRVTNTETGTPSFILGSPPQKHKTFNECDVRQVCENQVDSLQRSEKNDVFNKTLFTKGLADPSVRDMIRCRSESTMYKSCEDVALTSDWGNSYNESCSSACIQSAKEDSHFKQGSLHPTDRSDMTSVESINERVPKQVSKKIFKQLNGSHIRAPVKHSSRKQRRRSLSPACASEASRSPMNGRNSLPTTEEKYLETDLSQLYRLSTTDLGKNPSSCSSKKTIKKKRRSSVQQGIILDVAAIHGTHEKEINSDDDANYHTSVNSLANIPSPKLVISSYGGSKSRLNPNLCVTYSPSPSQRSESSTYHSSCLYPLDDCQRSQGFFEASKAVNNNKMRRISLPATASSFRCDSSQGVYNIQSSQSSVTMRRNSAALGILHHTSLPYIADTDTMPCMEARGSFDAQATGNEELRRSYLLCNEGSSGVCGIKGVQNKEVTDQTCHSNFGAVLSVLCFILFFWYLGMVYRRYANEAMSYDAFESLTTPDILSVHEIREIVVHISAEDLHNLPD